MYATPLRFLLICLLLSALRASAQPVSAQQLRMTTSPASSVFYYITRPEDVGEMDDDTGQPGQGTTYLPIGGEEELLLDRLQTMDGRFSGELHLSIKPVSRAAAVRFLEKRVRQESEVQSGLYRLDHLGRIDRYNIARALALSSEWVSNDSFARSRRPLFRIFYQRPTDFVYVRRKNFFLSLNPVLAGQVIGERTTGRDFRALYSNTRGGELRGRIANRIGFYSYFTDNQEEQPQYVQDWTEKHQAVPGADYYQSKTPGKYDYLQARGYVDFDAIPNHLNLTFGYDRQFYGDGLQSLFLSDFSAPATFLRINTRIWKLDYQNLFTEYTPDYKRTTDRVLPHKYSTTHILSVNATRWLNFGLFETVMFGRPDHYEFSYLNPIIFYREIERANGSPDNVLIGFQAKALPVRKVQLYAQFLLDEFRFSELRAGKGWWANKFGVQGGIKYYDVAGVRNLDAQAEVDIVRPFTYSHYDSIADYTHYNQPLAHPLGSAFASLTGTVRYQPLPRLYLSLKGLLYRQGADTGSLNYGNNLMKSYVTRTPVDASDPEHGYTVVSGFKTQCALADLTASYELRPRLFVDAGVLARRFTSENDVLPATNTVNVYAGIRINVARRAYGFY